MKHEWRKKEKAIYIPATDPQALTIPAYPFVTIKGAGNPNTELFGQHIQALYAVSYTIKMSLKKAETKPQNYTDWTVYPLEGVWDITDEAKENFSGTINKNDLVFELMIRQPDFISTEYFTEMLDLAKAKKGFELLDKVRFQTINEGPCIQAMHLGSFDTEAETFAKMEAFAQSQNLKRASKKHREIYLSDFRKVPAEKLKTTLRFQTST